MLFECNEALVLEAFRRGEFDYVDAIAEVRIASAKPASCLAAAAARADGNFDLQPELCCAAEPAALPGAADAQRNGPPKNIEQNAKAASGAWLTNSIMLALRSVQLALRRQGRAKAIPIDWTSLCPAATVAASRSWGRNLKKESLPRVPMHRSPGQ